MGASQEMIFCQQEVYITYINSLMVSAKAINYFLFAQFLKHMLA
jgi:hypothetical protein